MSTSLFLTLVLAAAPNPNPWEKAGETDGVTVYTREVPNSSVREVRAETVMPVPSKRIWEVLGDLEHYTEFMPYVVETRRLGKHAQGHFEYARLDPPFVSERDYVIKVTLTPDPATGLYLRSWEAVSDMVPPTKGVVRVPINSGSWTLEPTPDGKTHVTYYLFTDPGGAIPAWATNKANKTSLPDLLNAVKNRSLNPNWKR